MATQRQEGEERNRQCLLKAAAGCTLMAKRIEPPEHQSVVQLAKEVRLEHWRLALAAERAQGPIPPWMGQVKETCG